MTGEVASIALKARLKALGEKLPEPSRVRVHRSLSWLRRAEAETEDKDARFIFLWISFNAAYAHEFGYEQTERELLRGFLSKLLAVDAGRTLHQLVFKKFTGVVRVLIENKFVFEPFWRALREHDSSRRWEQRFEIEKKAAFRAVMGTATLSVLTVIFDRLYTLRNQLVHGGATWGGKVNRRQVSDGADLMNSLLPVILGLILSHPELDLGEIAYPVV
jgi:hypothetical protein